MKKGTKGATLLAAITLFTMVGCGEAPTDYNSATDASYAEVSMDDSGDDSDSEISSQESSKSAEAVSTAGASTTAPADALIEYNGKTISVFDDNETLMSSLGEQIPGYEEHTDDGWNYYCFGTKEDSVSYASATIDGKDIPISLGVYDKNVKTSKNIGIGNTKEELIAAYGDKYEDDPYAGNGGYIYDFGTYTINFTFYQDKVYGFIYTNTENDSKAKQTTK